MLLWLTVIEMKMIGKVVELKEDLTWVKKMEVAMMMMIVMIVVIIRPAMFQ